VFLYGIYSLKKKGEFIMPVISVEGSKLTKDQKRELIASLTEVASNIMKINKEAYVVVIKENDMDNIGIGGVLLSEKVKK
jgi:4-oxalocrotonate tautomerase